MNRFGRRAAHMPNEIVEASTASLRVIARTGVPDKLAKFGGLVDLKPGPAFNAFMAADTQVAGLIPEMGIARSTSADKL